MKLPTIWLGSADSYRQVVKAYEWGMEHPDYRPPGFQMLDRGSEEGEGEEDEETLVEFLARQQIEVYDNVGVLAIDGPLVNADSFWNAIFGLISYNTVSTALNMLAEDEQITEIVLNLGTPGGDSQGLEGVTDNIEQVKKLKPITAWSGTNALSAGYWLAAPASRVAGAGMAQFGSIGVITTATNYAKMLEKEGIEVEVIRAGEYKAPVHPAERMSEKGRSVLEAQTQKYYDFFLEHVARHRPVEITSKDSWAEGRVFFASEAIGVGLVDEVVSLNELVSRLTNVSEPTGEPHMSTQVILSEENRAKLASGVPLNELEHQAVETGAENTGAEGAETNLQAASEEGTGETAPETSAAPEGSGNELQAYLQGQLTSAQAELVSQRTENAKLATRGNELEEQNKALLGIAIEATHRLQVSLGQAPINLADMPSATVISYYGTCKDQFDKTFKAGRTSLDADESPQITGDSAARELGITPVG